MSSDLTEAEAQALEQAKTGQRVQKSSIRDIREQLAQAGDPSLKVISESDRSSGPEYRIVRSTPNGHTYVSPSHGVRELSIWLSGWIARGQSTPSVPD